MGNQHKHEILSNLSRSWMQQGNPSSSSFFCKIRISVWWVFTYVLFYALLAAAGLAKASADPNCVFAQGKLHVILLLTGRKWENCFCTTFFFFLSTTCQSVLRSHYIEVPQGDILMGQKMWFGLVLSRLAIWKKWSDYEQLLRTVFSYFQGKKRPHWKIAYYLF